MNSVLHVAPVRAYRSNRLRFLWLPVIGCFSLLLPLLFFWANAPESRGAGIGLSLVLGPAGVGILLIGLAYLRLQVELSEQGMKVALPRAGSEPWFPWLVRRATIAWNELRQIDVKMRSNPYAPGGVERLVLLRTDQGDFYLNSIWFREFDALLAGLQSASGATITEESLDGLPANLTAGTKQKLLLSERFVRSFGWVALGVVTLGSVFAGALVVTGQLDNPDDALFALLLLWLAYPAVRMLLRFRRAV